EDPFAMDDAAAALVADRITHFISFRAPDLFTNRLIHRLAPHLLTLGAIDRLDPDLIANRAIDRLDPHSPLFASVAALVISEIYAVFTEPPAVTVVIPAIPIRLRRRRSRAHRCNGGRARQAKR